MDNRDKQIEEMARIMCNCYDSGDCKMHGNSCDLKCISGFNALGLYNAGYRKASDVAEEIFAEIERGECKLSDFVSKSYLAELKKKYIGEDTNVTTKETEDN